MDAEARWLTVAIGRRPHKSRSRRDGRCSRLSPNSVEPLLKADQGNDLFFDMPVSWT
jgi:hypothetical protein